MSVGALLDRLEQHCPDALGELKTRTVACPHRLEPLMQSASIAIRDVEALMTHVEADWLPEDIRRSVPHRQASFVGGRLCAEFALAKLGVYHRGVGRHKGTPIWPTGVVGSISHTDRTAYAAVARGSSGARIGIDSEIILDSATTDVVRTHCCTANERTRWLAGGDVELFATLIFSVKEALYKAVHPVTGRFVEFDEVEVVDFDPVNRLIGLIPVAGKGLSTELGPARATFEIADGTVHTAVVHSFSKRG